MAAKFIKLSDRQYINLSGVDRLSVKIQWHMPFLKGTRYGIGIEGSASMGTEITTELKNIPVFQINFGKNGGEEAAEEALRLIMTTDEEVFDMGRFLEEHKSEWAKPKEGPYENLDDMDEEEI